MTNIFGPGHYVNTNETTTRPNPIATGKENDTWFQQCDANGAGGTNIDEMWLNAIIAALRSSVRSAGSTQGELIDDMLSEALARYASGGVQCVDSGSADAYVLTAHGNFIPPKSYFNGMRISYVPLNGNTGASTVNAFTLGNKALLDSDGVALAGGEITAGRRIEAVYSSGAAAGAGGFLVVPWCLGSTVSARWGECRLALSGGNLVLSPAGGGNRLSFPDGSTYGIPSAGISLGPSGLSVGTIYYIYAKIVSGAIQLEASATGYAVDSGTGIITKTGDTTRVLVGKVKIVTGPAFSDVEGSRLVLSWFNRRQIASKTQFSANRGTSATSAVELGSEIRNTFLTWGDIPVIYLANGPTITTGTNGKVLSTQVGFDGTPEAPISKTENYATLFHGDYSCVGRKYLSEAVEHYATLFGYVTSGGSGTWEASGSNLTIITHG